MTIYGPVFEPQHIMGGATICVILYLFSYVVLFLALCKQHAFSLFIHV